MIVNHSLLRDHAMALSVNEELYLSGRCLSSFSSLSELELEKLHPGITDQRLSGPRVLPNKKYFCCSVIGLVILSNV